jgi:phage baseplate assembly protein V
MNYWPYIKDLFSRMHGVVGFGRVKIVDDSGNSQKAQIYFNEDRIIDLIRVLHDFGFSSNPPPDSDACVVFASGDQSKGVAVGVNNQTLRPKGLNPGESIVYDANGNFIKLSSLGIEVFANSLPIKIHGASTAEIDSDITINITAGTVARIAGEIITLDSPLTTTTGDFQANNGWTGTFATGDMRTVTVQHGIITNVA